MVPPHTTLIPFLVLVCLPAFSFPLPDDDSSSTNQSLTRLISTSPGSKPPSCLNKCDSCTPCQAVQAAQDASDSSDVITDIGSRPPSCQNKCNRCNPCQAVQVPTPDPKQANKQEIHSVPPGPELRPPKVPEGEMNTHYSNYKPKGWRCQCGNKLFNP